ncbi:hypothetical protein [Nocardioides euryhalodurans]|uniref:Uncharacterized protein n=1 Tax=Nocardioides euryhalodurans TaxID=2518370 RepID=A0A4P7GP67_9ACTN|nr:hypothetical protein [Nocardioides euryhalodurans]QBR93754.1 hypothetical protein EXE57_16830 [Nocardioides euryhalodurans]
MSDPSPRFDYAAVELLIGLSGTWATDCGCMRVVDLQQDDIEDFMYEWAGGRYAVARNDDDTVIHQGPSAQDAIDEALHHNCG